MNPLKHLYTLPADVLWYKEILEKKEKKKNCPGVRVASTAVGALQLLLCLIPAKHYEICVTSIHRWVNEGSIKPSRSLKFTQRVNGKATMRSPPGVLSPKPTFLP